MTFEEILDHAIAMLQRRGRLTYGTLKRQFQLDDAALEDLKNELIEGQRLAVDERGNVLVWIGAAGPTSPAPSPSATTQEHAPPTYIPSYLAEKILTSRSALEGERKQVTVMFADLKGSTELIRDLDPEAAQRLLDPALQRMMDAVHRYEGTVNQVLGDGIMALFGAPLAHEDHAIRSCYAALAMHARIVEALEALLGDRLAERVERLAHHALRGEVWDKALRYHRQAGEKAMARSAFREGVACFEQALVTMPHLPEQREMLAQAIDLRLALDDALLASGEPRRGFAYLREAEALAAALDDQRRLGRICSAMTHGFWRTGDYDNALAYGQRALTLTAASGDVFEQARTHGRLGTVYFFVGDYRRAIVVLKRSIVALEGELRHTRPGMMVASVRSRTWLMDCLREQGEFAEGLACGEEAARIAEAAGHLGSAIFTQSRLGYLVLRQGNFPRAIPVLERTLAHCRAADIPLFLGGIMTNLGLAYALSGRAAEALPLLGQAVEQQRFSAQSGGSAEVLRLGEAYLLAGGLADAIPLAERALVLSRDRKERGNQAWALRLFGEIAIHRDPLEMEPAGDHYRQALSLAKELAMRPLQAHCHRSLGLLSAKIGRREEARVDLSAAIELYRAMDMTFWLPQAEAGLAQVEGR